MKRFIITLFLLFSFVSSAFANKIIFKIDKKAVVGGILYNWANFEKTIPSEHKEEIKELMKPFIDAKFSPVDSYGLSSNLKSLNNSGTWISDSQRRAMSKSLKSLSKIVDLGALAQEYIDSITEEQLERIEKEAQEFCEKARFDSPLTIYIMPGYNNYYSSWNKNFYMRTNITKYVIHHEISHKILTEAGFRKYGNEDELAAEAFRRTIDGFDTSFPTTHNITEEGMSKYTPLFSEWKESELSFEKFIKLK